MNNEKKSEKMKDGKNHNEKMKSEDIQQLIDRFMDGTTTLAEERRLAEFFRTAEPSGQWPEEWLAYKEMFAYFDEGMPEAVVPPSARKRRSLVVRVASVAAAAAVVAVMAGVAVFHLLEEPSGQIGCEPSAPVIIAQQAARDSVSVSVSESAPESVPVRESPCQSAKAPAPSPAPRKRLRDTPPLPKTYLADAAVQPLPDTISLSAKMLAEQKLYEVEVEQYEFVSSLYRDSEQAIAVLEAVDEEEERY